MATSTSSSLTQLEGARKAEEVNTSSRNRNEKEEIPELKDDGDYTSIQKTEVPNEDSKTTAPDTIDIERQGPKEPEVAIGRKAAILLFIGYVHSCHVPLQRSTIPVPHSLSLSCYSHCPSVAVHSINASEQRVQLLKAA